ncbi:MAG: hypothetical protein ACOYVF_13365 [Candidatus Zixiibacteriota bacterium]
MAFGKIIVTTVLSILAIAVAVPAFELPTSVFDREKQALKYSYTNLGLNAPFADEFDDTDNPEAVKLEEKTSKPGHKSPGRAFVYSLVLPGLGQYYYGSKVKAAFFLGTEITAWTLCLIWHADGVDLTDDFEAFNREHWIEDRYVDYLQMAYGEEYTDDEDIPVSENEGIIHNLPDTRTQQYYEMTGKYDQFAWGWEDAVLDGDSLYDFDAGNPPPKIYEEGTTPYSALRFVYEDMREDANNKFDNSKKMVMVAILNRLISGFEAYFMTKHRNSQAGNDNSFFSRVDFDARLKSCYAVNDTPFLKMTVKF